MAGTAPQELEQMRARVSTLEAENAHLRGQNSLTQSERDQLRQQVTSLATDLAKVQAEKGGEVARAVGVSENLVVMPKEVLPGEWVAVHVKNYPPRLLPQSGVALRGAGESNLAHITRLSAANVFLLTIPRSVRPGVYQVVLGEAGPLGPGAKVDDRVSITVRGP